MLRFRHATPGGQTAAATVTIFVAPVDIPLAAVSTGAGGFVVRGETPGDRAGHSVSQAGDVNGDGLDDVIVGAPGAPWSGTAASRSYMVFGKVDSAAVDLADLGSGGFVVNGAAEYESSGRSVSGAGDVNGDGLADLLIGADGASVNGLFSGRAYVVFGKAVNDAVELVSLGDGGFVVEGRRRRRQHRHQRQRGRGRQR